jgi:hypothetical protein
MECKFSTGERMTGKKWWKLPDPNNMGSSQTISAIVERIRINVVDSGRKNCPRLGAFGN